MARTLRAKLLGLFGIGQRKPATVIPRAGRRGQRLDFDIGGGDTTDVDGQPDRAHLCAPLC
jgi:hypothetical protein